MKSQYLKRKLYSHLKNNSCPICKSPLNKQLFCKSNEHLFLFSISDSGRIIQTKFSIINKISAPYVILDFPNDKTIILLNKSIINLNFIISTNFKDFSSIHNVIDKITILQ